MLLSINIATRHHIQLFICVQKLFKYLTIFTWYTYKTRLLLNKKNPDVSTLSVEEGVICGALLSAIVLPSFCKSFLFWIPSPLFSVLFSVIFHGRRRGGGHYGTLDSLWRNVISPRALRRRSSANLTLVHRRRRWANVKSALVLCVWTHPQRPRCTFTSDVAQSTCDMI